jgi:hypothetical protein
LRLLLAPAVEQIADQAALLRDGGPAGDGEADGEERKPKKRASAGHGLRLFVISAAGSGINPSKHP